MRKSKKTALSVTSFRLPQDVKDFLKRKAEADKRTISYVLIDFVRQWIAYDAAQAKQPKKPTKKPA